MHLVWVEPLEVAAPDELISATTTPDLSGTDSELATWFGANGAGTMDLADVASATDDSETADVTDVTDFAGGPDAPAVAEVGELANLSEVWNDEIGDVESTVIDEPAGRGASRRCPTGQPRALAQVPRVCPQLTARQPSGRLDFWAPNADEHRDAKNHA